MKIYTRVIPRLATIKAINEGRNSNKHRSICEIWSTVSIDVAVLNISDAGSEDLTFLRKKEVDSSDVKTISMVNGSGTMGSRSSRGLAYSVDPNPATMNSATKNMRV